MRKPAGDAQGVVEALAARLDDAGFKTGRTVVSGQVLVARRSEFRWEWLATRLHTFVIAFVLDELSAERAHQLAADAQTYAIQHKGGLPRGLQTGTATIALLLCPRADAETERWFAAEPQHRFAALRFPVLANEAGELTYFKGRWTHGHIYAGYIVGIVRDLIAPTLNIDG